MCAFITHWCVWMVVLYISFSQAVPSDPSGALLLAAPVLLEGILKRLVRTLSLAMAVYPSDILPQIWKKIISPKQGILHPRIYAAVDVLLSLTSTVTGPIKTLFRVVGGIICLFM